MTQFEEAQKAVKNGNLKPPSVSFEGKNVDYFGYQLAVHHFNLKIMAKGLKCRNIKFTDIKKYYGLKGRTAKDCLTQFEEVQNKYKESLK